MELDYIQCDPPSLINYYNPWPCCWIRTFHRILLGFPLAFVIGFACRQGMLHVPLPDTWPYPYHIWYLHNFFLVLTPVLYFHLSWFFLTLNLDISPLLRVSVECIRRSFILFSAVPEISSQYDKGKEGPWAGPIYWMCSIGDRRSTPWRRHSIFLWTAALLCGTGAKFGRQVTAWKEDSYSYRWLYVLIWSTHSKNQVVKEPFKLNTETNHSLWWSLYQCIESATAWSVVRLHPRS